MSLFKKKNDNFKSNDIHETNITLYSCQADVSKIWHYALNWLTNVDGITDWDNVLPRT